MLVFLFYLFKKTIIYLSPCLISSDYVKSIECFLKLSIGRDIYFSHLFHNILIFVKPHTRCQSILKYFIDIKIHVHYLFHLLSSESFVSTLTLYIFLSFQILCPSFHGHLRKTLSEFPEVLPFQTPASQYRHHTRVRSAMPHIQVPVFHNVG